MTNQQRIDAIKELAKGLNFEEILHLEEFFADSADEIFKDVMRPSCPLITAELNREIKHAVETVTEYFHPVMEIKAE